MDRFTNGGTNKAFEADKHNEHTPSRTNKPVKPSNMKERNNMLKLHQANQGASKNPRTSPCRGEATVHHEDVLHSVAL